MPKLLDEDTSNNETRDIHTEIADTSTILDNINEESFLGAMGYSTQKSSSERYTILTAAVQKYGKNKVIKFLNNMINWRMRQRNGAEKYATAISVWKADILRVQKLQIN